MSKNFTSLGFMSGTSADGVDASVILSNGTDFCEILKEKYNMQELTSAEKRELQQIILKKDKMSQDEEALIKNLSSI